MAKPAKVPYISGKLGTKSLEPGTWSECTDAAAEVGRTHMDVTCGVVSTVMSLA